MAARINKNTPDKTMPAIPNPLPARPFFRIVTSPTIERISPMNGSNNIMTSEIKVKLLPKEGKNLEFMKSINTGNKTEIMNPAMHSLLYFFFGSDIGRPSSTLFSFIKQEPVNVNIIA